MDDTARLACCLICTLASVMKDCKHCAFYEAFKAHQEAQRAQDKNTVLSFQQKELKPCMPLSTVLN